MASILSILGLLAAVYGRSVVPAAAPGQASSPSSVPTNTSYDLYVSASGSDVTGDGTSSKPWATIQHARDVISGSGSLMTQDRTIHIAPGTYRQIASINFGAADSGGNGHMVWYQCDGAPGNECVFDGGKRVTGWTTYSGSISRAPVTPGVPFYALWENGRSARVARSPNLVYDPLFPTAQGPYFRAADTTTGQQNVMQYDPADIDLSLLGSLTGLQVYIWAGDTAIWYTDTMPITSVNTSTHLLTPARLFTLPIYRGGNKSRYIVQNLLPLLDAPGEWYQDVAGGWLYYWPMDGAAGSQDIEIPVVQDVFRVVGTDANTRVSHVGFDGLTVQHADFLSQYLLGCAAAFHTTEPAELAAGGSPCNDPHPLAPNPNFYSFYYESATQWHGLFLVQAADHITIQNSHLENGGLNGIYANDYVQNLIVTNDWIDRVGHSGVYLEGRYPGEGDVNNNNTVSNSIIETYGLLVGNGQGIIQQQSGHNLISHAEVFNGPRDAVYTNGGSDSMTLPASGGCQDCIYARSTTYQYLRLHDCCQDSDDEAGLGIFSLNSEPGTSGPYVSNTYNQIEVYGAYNDPSVILTDVHGMYTDNRTAGQSISNVETFDLVGFLALYNESGEHTLTNVSWDPSVVGGVGTVGIATANPSFSSAAMDYANIGCPNTNPWYATAKAKWDFSDGFENGSSNWTASTGSTTVSTAQAHSGTHSVLQQDLQRVYKVLETRRRGTVTLWLRDDATNTNLQAVAHVDQATIASGTWSTYDNSAIRGLAVDTRFSVDHYVYFVGNSVVTTSVARTTGWHQFKWDYTSDTGVTMSIDGTAVASNIAGVRHFDVVSMGNGIGGGTAGTIYWDDVSVVDQ